MTTLGAMRERGERISLYCAAYLGGRHCNTTWHPSWDQMVQYFGLDFEISSDRDRFLAMFECPNCGSPAYSITLRPPADTLGMGGGYGHDHGQPLTIEEATRRHHEFEAERKRLGIKSIAEANAESRALLRAQKRAEKAGDCFIGPPNPYAHRKRGRWAL